jgi:hypothetical protein
MPCYYSDHCALVAVIHAGGGEELKWYHQRTQQFPISLPRGPRKQLDAEYEELQRDVVHPPLREHPANSWITTETWKLIDHYAMLRRKGMLSQAAACGLGRQVKAQFAADHIKCAKNTALTIEGCLAVGDFVEAWHNLKGWYRLVEDRAPKACPETLALQTAERVELYTTPPPPGWSMPINVTPIPVPDGTPTDHEIWEVVGKLRNGRAAGATGMQAEHLKEWLRGIKREEAADGVEGAGDCWRLLVALMQATWKSGTVPTQMSWMVIMFLPKGGGDYCGIGLLDSMWKVVEKIMVARMSCLKLHDCLHGRLLRRGTGAAIMEVKLNQQLAWVDQAPLYQIYLDLKKAYNALDQMRCLEILAGYGVGPNVLHLQKHFWDGARMVCRAGGSYGEPFSARRGITQGGPLSSLMFNVCVNAVVREWLRQCLGDDAARMGIGEAVRDHVVVFFVDDGLVAARCPEWLQSSFTILLHLFKRIGLKTIMTCLPGKIRVAKTEEEYTAQQTGNTTAAKRWQVDCEVCGISLAAESL